MKLTQIANANASILVLDATTEACSVALLHQGEITEEHQIAPRGHASLLLPMVDKLLSKGQLKLAQLDAIGCGVGPGAFTGIRIGVSVAQGLAFGANLPTIALSGLANMAQQAFDESDADICWSAIDARMQEIYFGVFYRDEQGLAQPLNAEQVISPVNVNLSELVVLSEDREVVAIGSGWAAYPDELNLEAVKVHAIENKFPKASSGLKQAVVCLQQRQLLPPAQLQPVYLRNQVAKKKGEQK